MVESPLFVQEGFYRKERDITPEVPEIKEREIPVICYDIIFYGISIFSFL
jgi:hypothetical protein